jgi:hypothetical protein
MSFFYLIIDDYTNYLHATLFESENRECLILPGLFWAMLPM